MKFIATVIVIILLICGGALWFLAGGSLNEFVKAQIEQQGKTVTEQTVTVANVDLKLTQGAGTISGFILPNPPGYKAANIFSLGEITLDINVESLVSEPIIIDAIVIKNPEAFVEVTESGQANVKELLDIINKNIPASTSDASEPAEQSTRPEPRIAVKKLVLAGTALTVDLTGLGNKAHQVTLPDITVANIGGEQGLPASQLGQVIMKEMLSNLWQHTKKVQTEKLKDKAKDKLKKEAEKQLLKLFN